MTETRKIAAILVADVVGYSRLAGADEDGTLARLRALRSDLIDPTIAVHHGRIVKRTGDGFIVEFRSVVDAVRCAIEVQNGMIERNAGVPEDRRIEFRIGIHLGDVVEEADGDLMGDGVNIAARLEGIAKPGRDLSLRARLLAGERAARSRGQRSRPDPAQEHRRADPGLFARRRPAGPGEARADPPRRKSGPAAPLDRRSAVRQYRRRPGAGAFRRRGHGEPDDRPLADTRRLRDRPQHGVHLQGQAARREDDRARVERPLCRSRAAFSAAATACASTCSSSTPKPAIIFGPSGSTSRSTDLFDMQDEIVARLANALNAQLAAAEARRAEQAPNPDSMDLYFQGLAWLNKGVDP